MKKNPSPSEEESPSQKITDCQDELDRLGDVFAYIEESFTQRGPGETVEYTEKGFNGLAHLMTILKKETENLIESLEEIKEEIN